MKNKLILLVEDNPDDRELTKRALKESDLHQFNIELVIAVDGQQALDKLFGAHGVDKITPDLVLLDLKLSKISGIEVLKEIRTRDETRRLPVVVLTTSSEDADIAESYDNGANSYIRKPVVFKDFINQVDYIVTYWFTCNQFAKVR